MALRFRNIDADPDDPVETWPLKGIVTALERGGCPTAGGRRPRSRNNRGGTSPAVSWRRWR